MLVGQFIYVSELTKYLFDYLPYILTITISIICSILVIVSANPMWSLLFFNTYVLCNCGILILLDQVFFAIIFVIIYVGAITIFFLSAIMSLDRQQIEAFTSTKNTSLIVLILIFSLFASITNCDFGTDIGFFSDISILADNSDWVNNDTTAIKDIGYLFTKQFLIPVVSCFIILITIIIFLIGLNYAEDL
jgi:NADH:ubiquinone oxidoreductase subunit 6 (subunit J)